MMFFPKLALFHRIPGNRGCLPVEKERERDRNIGAAGHGNKINGAGAAHFRALLGDHLRHSAHIDGVFIPFDGTRFNRGAGQKRNRQQIQSAAVAGYVGHRGAGRRNTLVVECFDSGCLNRGTSGEQGRRSEQGKQEHVFFLHFSILSFVWISWSKPVPPVSCRTLLTDVL